MKVRCHGMVTRVTIIDVKKKIHPYGGKDHACVNLALYVLRIFYVTVVRSPCLMLGEFL